MANVVFYRQGFSSRVPTSAGDVDLGFGNFRIQVIFSNSDAGAHVDAVDDFNYSADGGENWCAIIKSHILQPIDYYVVGGKIRHCALDSNDEWDTLINTDNNISRTNSKSPNLNGHNAVRIIPVPLYTTPIVDLYHAHLMYSDDFNGGNVLITNLPNQAFTQPERTKGDLNRSYED